MEINHKHFWRRRVGDIKKRINLSPGIFLDTAKFRSTPWLPNVRHICASGHDDDVAPIAFIVSSKLLSLSFPNIKIQIGGGISPSRMFQQFTEVLYVIRAIS